MTSSLCSDEYDAVAGDFWHLPAGLVHALGAGTMVAEIQTPSDTTFRMYDWSVEYDRQARELHREAALSSIRLDLPEHHVPKGRGLAGYRVLTDNSHYRVVEHKTDGDGIVVGTSPGPSVLLAVSGTIVLGDLTLDTGATAVVPHESGEVVFHANAEATVLEVTLSVSSVRRPTSRIES